MEIRWGSLGHVMSREYMGLGRPRIKGILSANMGMNIELGAMTGCAPFMAQFCLGYKPTLVGINGS